jgi:hypothetical protein
MKTLHTKTHDGTPLTVIQWSTENPNHVTAADQTISELNGLGYTVAQITGNGKQWQVILTKEAKV